MIVSDAFNSKWSPKARKLRRIELTLHIPPGEIIL